MNLYAKERCAEIVLNASAMMPYRKIDKCKYEIYCTRCREYKKVDYKELTQIRNAKVCPMCHRRIKPTTQNELKPYNFIRIENTGYKVDIDWVWGKKPRCTGTKEVAKWKVNRNNTEVVSVRQIGYNLGSYGICCLPYRDWTKFRKNERYNQDFYNYFREMYFREMMDCSYMKRKDYYEYLANYNGIDLSKLKSNQQKLVKDNLLTYEEINAIKLFNLKSYDELMKHRVWIRNNCRRKYEYEFNVYLLDYLCRNKIALGDYLDYMKQCELLGFKLDKPKDFTNRHQRYGEIIAEKENEITNKGIKKRYAELKQYTYSTRKGVIKPFDSINELIRCGKELHNCIGTYAKDYADKDTNLFHLDVNRKMTIAIEIKDGVLIQARANNNDDCPSDLLKIIMQWCKKYNWSAELD